jgi:hypothetical protein
MEPDEPARQDESKQAGVTPLPPAPLVAEKGESRPVALPPIPAARGGDKERWPDLPALGERVARDFGRVASVSERRGVPVVIFAEAHNSRAEQIEIARMLLRLYRQGLRHLAVEGHVQGIVADAAWFHNDPGTLPQRRRLAAQFLEDGEIGCAEFLALVLPEVTLHPIERAEEYAPPLPQNPEAVAQAYLDAIVQQSPDDPWVTARSTAMPAAAGLQTSEALLALAKGLQKRAADVGAPIDASARAGMEQLIRFLAARARASDTMVAATLGVVKEFPGVPVALHIGAAHTKRVTQLLTAAGQPYLVIMPQSYTGSEKGDVSRAALYRRDRKLSVDDDDRPGALLDGRGARKAVGNRGRKRAAPVFAEPWFRAKVDLYTLCAEVARAAEGLGSSRPPREPPFGIPAADPGRPRATLVRGTMRKVGGEVVFAVDVMPRADKSKRRVWMRAIHVPRSPQAASALDGSSLESLEELLSRALHRVRSGQSLAELATEEFRTAGSTRPVVVRERGPQTVQVDCDTLAIVAPMRPGIAAPITSPR